MSDLFKTYMRLLVGFLMFGLFLRALDWIITFVSR